jgi:hypothetical protein
MVKRLLDDALGDVGERTASTKLRSISLELDGGGRRDAHICHADIG